MCVAEKSTVTAKVGQKTAKGKTTNTASEPVVYLNLPADYSGDIWHVAAALVVDCRVQVVFTIQSEGKETKNYKTVAKAKAFFQSIGILPERFHEVMIKPFAASSQAADSLIREMEIEVDDPDIKKDIFTARTHQAEATKAMGQPVHAVYSSTYIWVKAIEDKGRDVVLKAIKAAFVLGFEDSHPKESKAIRDRIAEVTYGAKKFLFLNMRMANYHPEDNTSRSIYNKIAGIANNNKGMRLIRVGSFNPGDKVHTGPKGEWMEDLATEVIDIYGFCTLESGLADMQSVAYFWAQVAAAPDCLGVAGGRSGSSDIAGLMGNRLLCWTICRPQDPGYQRQQIMVGRIMSLIDLNADIADYETHRKHYDADFTECPGTLVKAAVCCFAKRTFFGPYCYGSLTPADKELHEMVKGPGGRLSFCMTMTKDAALSALELPKKAYNARALLLRAYAIGHADGRGLNCLLRSLYQLKYGSGKDLTKEGNLAIETYRREIAAAYDVGEDEQLDFVTHGTPVLAQFGIRVRLIRIDSTGNLQDTGLELGNLTDPLRYILYEGDGWAGHFSPLYPVLKE
ncbi:MAG: hypothetical protein NTW28_02765 [Candidatus Solibacter sp.]|nr:hypothetical protein [Candidatus Solibacter sp.]